MMADRSEAAPTPLSSVLETLNDLQTQLNSLSGLVESLAPAQQTDAHVLPVLDVRDVRKHCQRRLSDVLYTYGLMDSEKKLDFNRYYAINKRLTDERANLRRKYANFDDIRRALDEQATDRLAEAVVFRASLKADVQARTYDRVPEPREVEIRLPRRVRSSRSSFNIACLRGEEDLIEAARDSRGDARGAHVQTWHAATNQHRMQRAPLRASLPPMSLQVPEAMQRATTPDSHLYEELITRAQVHPQPRDSPSPGYEVPDNVADGSNVLLEDDDRQSNLVVVEVGRPLPAGPSLLGQEEMAADYYSMPAQEHEEPIYQTINKHRVDERQSSVETDQYDSVWSAVESTSTHPHLSSIELESAEEVVETAPRKRSNFAAARKTVSSSGEAVQASQDHEEAVVLKDGSHNQTTQTIEPAWLSDLLLRSTIKMLRGRGTDSHSIFNDNL